MAAKLCIWEDSEKIGVLLDRKELNRHYCRKKPQTRCLLYGNEGLYIPRANVRGLGLLFWSVLWWWGLFGNFEWRSDMVR